MTIVRMMKLSVLCAAVFLCGARAANADTINFQSDAPDTVLSNVDGVRMSTFGGPGAPGSPVIGLQQFGFQGLANTSDFAPSSFSNGYPTSDILDFRFRAPVSGVSLTFDNYGGIESFYDAFDSHHNLLETGSLTTTEGGLVTLSATGIADLQLNNDTSGTDSWVFAVGELNFTPDVATAVATAPEPDSLTLMGFGLAAVGGCILAKRRREKSTDEGIPARVG